MKRRADNEPDFLWRPRAESSRLRWRRSSPEGHPGCNWRAGANEPSLTVRVLLDRMFPSQNNHSVCQRSDPCLGRLSGCLVRSWTSLIWSELGDGRAAQAPWDLLDTGTAIFRGLMVGGEVTPLCSSPTSSDKNPSVRFHHGSCTCRPSTLLLFPGADPEA